MAATSVPIFPAVANGDNLKAIADMRAQIADMQTQLDNIEDQSIKEQLDGMDGRLGGIEDRLTEFTIQLRASDTNQIARISNSGCNDRPSRLTPLVNATTGQVIEGFPDTVGDLLQLNAQEVNAILGALNQQASGGALAVRRARLLRAIGVVLVLRNL